MAEPQSALMQAVRNALKMNTVLSSVLHDPPMFNMVSHVDNVDHKTALFFGDSDIKPWRSATYDGTRHHFTLVVRSPLDCYEGNKEIIDTIIGVLHDADLHLSGHVLIDLSFASAETRSLQHYIESKIVFDAITVTDD